MKHIVVIGGYAGSGKTELGKLLARKTRWTLLDKDTLTRPLVDALASTICGDPDDRETSRYVEEIRPLEYRVLFDTAQEVLAQGASPILTAPFIVEAKDPNFKFRLMDLAHREGATLHTVWVVADEHTMLERLSARGADRDRWKLVNWEAYFASVNPNMRPGFVENFVDNSASSPTTLGESVDTLTAWWGVRE